MDGRPVGSDLLVLGALVALGVFVFSGGVHAAADGAVRSAALVAGLAAMALAVLLLFAYGRTIGGPRDRFAGRR